MGRRSRNGYMHLSEVEYHNLLNGAMSVAFKSNTPPYEDNKRCIRTVKTQVEVPVEETVQVPVQKKVPQRRTERKIVRGKQLVPVEKVKEVKETAVEVQEEVVHGYRWVWKRVKEPTKEVVKKPVTVTKVRQVPYTDYEEREVEMVVDVPCDKVEVQRGYRQDKKLSTKTVEVEQDEIYAVRPLYLGKGELRMREYDGRRELGYTRVGREVFPERSLHEGRGASVSGGHSNMERSMRPKLSPDTMRRSSSARGAPTAQTGYSGGVAPPSRPRSARGRPHPHGLAARMRAGPRSIL